MSFIFDFIVWSPDPEIFSIGPLSIRWYGLLFALGFLIGQQILIHIYKAEGKTEKHVEVLTVYMVLATIIGARLGHCLFYEPKWYLSHPLDILKIWEGGLASHGATVGILIAIYLYSRKQTDQSYLYVLDRMVITIALAGALIRTGNLMNSEIIGKPTNVPYGFVFARSVESNLQESYGDYFKKFEVQKIDSDTVIGNQKVQGLEVMISEPVGQRVNVSELVKDGIPKTLTNTRNESSEHVILPEGGLHAQKALQGGKAKLAFDLWGIPRHPAQLYEAISSLLLFFLLFGVWKNKKGNLREGRIFGLFCTILFSLRFLFEFLKEPQVEFESTMALNMGQILSIPMVIIGLFILMRSYRKQNEIS